jgi:hypothetical protein
VEVRPGQVQVGHLRRQQEVAEEVGHLGLRQGNQREVAEGRRGCRPRRVGQVEAAPGEIRASPVEVWKEAGLREGELRPSVAGPSVAEPAPWWEVVHPQLGEEVPLQQFSSPSDLAHLHLAVVLP